MGDLVSGRLDVLVLTVGGSEEPIVNAIHQNHPDFVVFLCTGGSPQAASERAIEGVVRAARAGECPRCGARFEIETFAGPVVEHAGLAPGSYGIVTVTNPDDLDQVLVACQEVEDVVARRSKDAEARIVANYTGGTKTMTLGLGLYAVLRGHPWQLQVNATGRGRTDLIRVEVGDSSIAQPAAVARALSARSAAELLIDGHEYAAAAAVLEDALRTIGAGAAAGLAELRHRALYLAAVDSFDYDRALQLARADRALKKSEGGRLRAILRTRRRIAGEQSWPADNPPGSELVRDLMENARRHAARGHYDDAVARLYRATELVAQLRLAHGWGVDTADVGSATNRLPGPAAEWLHSLPVAASGKKQLGLTRAFQLLALLGDPAGELFNRTSDDVKRWLRRRNFSLMAHGLQPVDRVAWEREGAEWLTWLEDAADLLDQPRGGEKPPAPGPPEAPGP